ncbi:MAG: heme-copper oxidase subunit III [Chloroflexi bacterium]|nr:heme-copper oxidase subunit III [Chloroflexota bacterium]
MWLFLASECLFFGSLIAAFLLYRGTAQDTILQTRDQLITQGLTLEQAKRESGPLLSEVLDIPFTSISAFQLLMSSVTMVLALAAIQRDDRRGARIWLLATALLGIAFISGQAFEFTEFHQHGLSLSVNLFGTTFFVLTGFHGAHVSVGVLILLSLVVMSLRGKLTQANSLTVELAGLYWHFVDIVWIAIFTLVYLIQP